MKIKIFKDFLLDRLENCVNQWLKLNEKYVVKSISQSYALEYFIITVLYKEK